MKEARKLKKMSQEKLGLEAEMEISTARSRISQYENDAVNPPFELVCKFADVLGMPESYFYTRDDAFAEKILSLYRIETEGRSDNKKSKKRAD
ncbi:helix-turn-helix domain-containing protein [Serratia symbiotica]|uniref:helix-turn-helix domain-containing protein n=1 Tax=Serratia symbiotica TaxID=138074 RepID=UPI003AF62E4D